MKTFTQYDNLVTEVQNVIGEGPTDGKTIGTNIMFDTQKKVGGSIPVWYLDFHQIDRNTNTFRFGIAINHKVKIGNELLVDIFDKERLRPSDKIKDRLEKIVYKHLGRDVKLSYGSPQYVRGAYGGVMYVDGVKE